ncbi:serine/threonine-protein kinase Rio1 [Natranaeroarchaeum sulfidigenes]|uniref:non-specific serine/threonine protein kinase n=1 Tax=Natranaeroarchaeum sulfidigenes TaxID=2784880 RepID=A0A897MLC2_9EURY|nr:serine/threonine-protein kinase Rio1 [Natranaeroarchaeum sulfidigenes]QSG01397.1 Serine/threonine protein kinase involved in cellcycle control [Natranaeroarchaeum sulfidigenes]
MTGEYGLLEPDESDAPGDEFEQIDVSDTEADRIARKRDREFSQFRKRIKDSDRFKVDDGAFDDATFAALYKLVQDGYVDAIGGPLSTGKEANVYNALAGERSLDLLREGEEEVAMKVYRTRATNFQDMREYLVGDPRFEELGDKKKIVMAWTRKELSNLERARKAGVRVPQPLAVERNVLIMEYIGTEDGRAKRLTEVSIENPETAFEVVREYIRRLYAAGLVHGDLSEYNVLFYDGELVVIDVGQAVTVHHPNAEEFLERDCENVASFFRRQGMDVSGDELLAWVQEHAEP